MIGAAHRRLALPLCALITGCKPADTPAPAPSPTAALPAGPAWFEDQAPSRGVQFVYEPGPADRYLMPEIMGGGAALFDMDGDQDLDLYCVQGGDLLADDAARPPNQLFENQGDGRFVNVTEGSGAGDRGYGMGVTAGDYDDDGDVDLYVTNCGPDVLLANDGAGRFTDVTADAGLQRDGWSSSAAFFDADGDRDLDLWVCHYLEWTPEMKLKCFNTMGGRDYCSPRNYMAPAQDRLYLNQGNGHYADVTRLLGIDGTKGTGLGVVCADFDRDGAMDVFVSNDGMADHLWMNGGTFSEIAVRGGCAYDRDGRAAAGMGVAAADIDEDGDLDLLVGNLRNESDSFFRNDGHVFSNVTAAMGLGSLSRQYTRFGLGLFDFDNDRRLDLFQANGRVMRQAPIHGDDPYAEPNLLFRGTADGRFEPARATAAPLPGTSRAAAFGDIDGDGGIDVVVIEREGPARVLMNIVPDRGSYLGFDVRTSAGAPAIGASVTVRVGDRALTRVVQPASSYMASNDPRVHFGLGDATAIDQVTVRWPGGMTRELGAVEVGSVHVVVP